MRPLRCERKRALSLVMDLLALDGPSQEEADVAVYVAERARAAGVPRDRILFDSAHLRTPHGGQIGNLVVDLPGDAQGPRRLLAAHLDTVLPAAGSRPVLKKDRILDARGSCLGADDRSGVAAILYALETLVSRSLPHPPLTFLFTVQEEIGLFGARYVSRRLLKRPRMGFSFDGESPSLLVIGAPSHIQMEISISGIAAHAGAHPEDGVSALLIASRALCRLERAGWTGKINRRNRTATTNVGVVDGGQATNIVMSEMLLKAEARSHEEAFLSKAVQAHREAFERAARSVENSAGRRGSVAFAWHRAYTAFKLSEDDEAVKAAVAAARSLGLRPRTHVGFGGLDANWLNHHGIPTVTLGSGALNAHSSRERLDLERFFRGCEVATALALGPSRASRL